MNNKKILELAREYMEKYDIDAIFPGDVGRVSGDLVEVIFIKPIALDPNTIACPPDNRVWVNIKTQEVTWIEQM